MPEVIEVAPTTADDEATLVAAARVAPCAFASLYRRHVDPIYRFCYRRLGAREAAEDATAQVFAKALAGLPGFRGGSFQGWLFAIASHVVADEGRTARSHAPLAAAVGVADPAPGPEEAAVRSEAAGAVRAVLAQLPPEQRHVLELRLAGLTSVEIAVASGRSHGTIRNLQHRTLIRLRDLLGVTPPREGPDA
ncbi:MAG TPA: sigma-70 family RNA polymerase sigma factor [Thermomicrobiales bacterium]|jgi:RNA polymerase sigma-70 factor (ECF subfamily)